MSYHRVFQIGIIEKASKIALRYHVTYDPRAQIFNGDPAAVDKADAALAKWRQAEQLKALRNARRD